MPLRVEISSSAQPPRIHGTDELTAFSTLKQVNRSADAIEEACGPATLDDSDGEPYCRITSDFKYQHLILRASDGWIVGIYPLDSSRPSPPRLESAGDAPGCWRPRDASYSCGIPRSGTPDPTIEEFMHFTATGEASVVIDLHRRETTTPRSSVQVQRRVLRNSHRQPQCAAG